MPDHVDQEDLERLLRHARYGRRMAALLDEYEAGFISAEEALTRFRATVDRYDRGPD